MQRTTQVQLFNALARLNNLFGYKPSGTQPTPGTFVLQGAYGGYQLQRVVEGGGVMSITSGYRSKREVAEYIYAMLQGAAMMERHKVEKAQMI